MSLIKGILQQNHIRLLMKINDKAKVRRSTKLVVLGIARVMSYKDLKEARAKRAEKDATKEAKKGKRNRKRKSALEADALKIDSSELKAKRARKVRKAKILEVSGVESWSVPVA